MTLYSFDTSALLNGRRDLLPPDTFPTAWAQLEDLIGQTVVCVDVVREELVRKDDEVSRWAKTQGGLFVPLDEDVQKQTAATLERCPKLVGRGGGRNMADPFVIGLALASGGIVVTEETPSGNLDKPRIPDVCKELGVKCLSLVGFIQAQGWTF